MRSSLNTYRSSTEIELSIVSPSNVNLIRAKSLCASAVVQLRFKSSPVCKQSSMSNHDPVIDAKPFVSRIDTPSSFHRHQPHHLLQPLITAHPSNNQNLTRPDMRHRPLRNLHQHRKHRLLQRKAQIRLRHQLPRHRIPHPALPFPFSPLHLPRQLLHPRQNPTKTTIHPLHRVRQIHQYPSLPLLRNLLNIIPRRRIIADPQHPRKPIQTIPHRDVQRLAEDPVPAGGVRDYLRVSAGYVKYDRVQGAGDLAAHLDVPDAVVHSD